MAAMDRLDLLRDLLGRRLDPRPDPSIPPDTALAAVLIPMVAVGAEPRLVLTKRSAHLPRHPGEISFPGGLIDPQEEPSAAALRESREELGLEPADIELLGALPPVHTHVSGILIVPFVGWMRKEPGYAPNADEIEEVLEFPLDRLAQSGRQQEMEIDGTVFHTYVYDMDGWVIWGATARILWSFLELVRPWSRGRPEPSMDRWRHWLKEEAL
jgi:8-oxo-dGTP pyrophosphatase MutT (NUDIX family)